MLPHLRQIRHFADFRLKVAAIRSAAEKGATKEELSRLAQEAWDPVPEYNTWIGSFGQPEAVMQEQMILALAKEFGLTVTTPPALRWRDAERQLERIQNSQRASSVAYEFKPQEKGTFWWTPEKTRDRFQLLIDHGCVREVRPGIYQVSDWQAYRQH